MGLPRLAVVVVVTIVCLPLQARLPEDKRKELEAALPDARVDEPLIDRLAEIFYSHDLPVHDRLQAISRMVGLDQMPEGQQLERTICVWDLGGRNGPVFNAAMQQRALALEYGVRLHLEPYTNEGVMVDAFKAGHCDAALMSGLRARQFNQYTGTVDAIGALPTPRHMRTLLQVLAHPEQAGHMVQGEYVVMGIFPAGAAYVFVNDREISTLARAAGHKVAVLAYDQTQAEMVAAMGATPVRTDFVSAPRMFNNGQVDILPAPLVAYEYLELYKGMKPDGGIVDYPFTQLSMQLIGRRDAFPNVMAQLIREASFEAWGRIRQRIRRETRRVPQRWFISISEQEKTRYEVMMRDARRALVKQDYYNEAMLDLQRRVRCKHDPGRAECSGG